MLLDTGRGAFNTLNKLVSNAKLIVISAAVKESYFAAAGFTVCAMN
jgi:hypothetical protein